MKREEIDSRVRKLHFVEFYGKTFAAHNEVVDLIEQIVEEEAFTVDELCVIKSLAVVKNRECPKNGGFTAWFDKALHSVIKKATKSLSKLPEGKKEHTFEDILAETKAVRESGEKKKYKSAGICVDCAKMLGGKQGGHAIGMWREECFVCKKEKALADSLRDFGVPSDKIPGLND